VPPEELDAARGGSATGGGSGADLMKRDPKLIARAISGLDTMMAGLEQRRCDAERSNRDDAQTLRVLRERRARTAAQLERVSTRLAENEAERARLGESHATSSKAALDAVRAAEAALAAARSGGRRVQQRAARGDLAARRGFTTAQTTIDYVKAPHRNVGRKGLEATMGAAGFGGDGD